MLKYSINSALKALCSVKEEDLGAAGTEVDLKMSPHLLNSLDSIFRCLFFFRCVFHIERVIYH